MELHERLTAARIAANFATAADAAAALGVKYPTYAGHENGSSGFRAETGEHYAKKFKVRFEWLMRGVGPMKADAQSEKSDQVVAAFARLLPLLPEGRRRRLLADLADAARLEGLEEFAPDVGDEAGKAGG